MFDRIRFHFLKNVWPTFARAIDAAKKYVVSSTLDRAIGTRSSCAGDLGEAAQQLKGVG